jgi:long-chain fatty acid transport protein
MKKILFALLVASAAPSQAGGLAVGEQNAVSAGTAGAGAARTDDPGLAWHDPAALADDGGWRVGLSLAAAKPSVTTTSAEGTTDSASTWQTPPHLDASFAQGHWAAGLAVGVPFGGGITWPSNWSGATQAVQTQLMDIRTAPFAAYRIGKLRVAAGVHFDAARLQIARNLDFIDTQGDVRLDLAGHGFGADVSAYYAARPDLGIAVAYRSRTRIDFSGNANFTAPDAFSEKTPDQHATTSMTMPDQLVVGAAYTRNTLTFIGEVEYTRWSVDPDTTVHFEMPQTPDAIQVNGWKNTFTERGGAEWHRDDLTVRGGAYYDKSPVPTAHLTPSSPDSSRIGVTAGASYRLAPAWTADAFAEQMWLMSRQTTSVDTMPASYGGSAIVVGAGVRWISR